MSWKFGFFAGAMIASMIACGGGVTTQTDSGSNPGMDAASPDDAAMMEDAGMMMVPYPAPHPPMPRVISQGGPTVGNGTVVPVFWPNDPYQAQVEDLLKQMSPSAYWTAITKEYGVGDFQLAPSIVVSDPQPVQIDDSEIATWLATQADGTHSPWPLANDTTVFAIFYPSGTSVTLQGLPSCQGFGGYHNSTKLGDGTPFAYAVMPRCGSIDSLTGTTSHEMMEWATDPLPLSKPAFNVIDKDHYIWSLGLGWEIGDMCETYQTSYARLLGNYRVQRGWSNASAKASHDPCVPAPTDAAYFNAAPDLPDTVKFSYNGSTLTTKGIRIPPGMSATIDVYLYSDGPTNGPWSVSARDRTGSSTYLTFAWDKNTGQNGDILHLTINALKATTSGASSFTITSADKANHRHSWTGLVGYN